MHCFLPLLSRGSDRGQGKDAQKGEAEKEIRKRVDGRGKSSLLGVLAWTQYKLTRLSDHRQKGEGKMSPPSFRSRFLLVGKAGQESFSICVHAQGLIQHTALSLEVSFLIVWPPLLGQRA